MKKNDNEIKILMLLLAFIVFYGFYAFILRPKIDSTALLKTQVDQEDALVREMYNNTLQYNTNVEKIKSVSEYILDNSKSFYVDAKQEKLIDQIEEWLNESELKYESIRFENPCYYNLKYIKEDGTQITNIKDLVPEDNDNGQKVVKRDYDIILENSKNGTENQGDLDPVLWNTVVINAIGKQSEVENFLNELNTFDKKTISSEFTFEITPESIEENLEDPNTKISIQIDFLNLTNPNLSGKNSDEIYEIPEMPTDFIMPSNFSSGAYRNPFSFDFIKNLF